MSLKAYAKNTAQQFVRLKERILQLWKWIMAATILSLERQTVEICTEISQDLVFAFMWLVNTLYRMMSHCGAAKVEPGCTVFCRAPCVSNPTASTDRLHSDEWEGCVFHIGHVGFLKGHSVSCIDIDTDHWQQTYVESSKEDIIPRDDWINKIKAIIHPHTVQAIARRGSYISFTRFILYNLEIDWTHFWSFGGSGNKLHFHIITL